MERTLSIFCDESGDFGAPSAHSPYYLISLVFHDQGSPVDRQVADLERALSFEPTPAGEPVHTAPLIRREPPYTGLGLRERRRIFAHLEHFARACDIKTKVILVNKGDFGGGDALAERLARELGLFIRNNLAYFQSFDKVIVYYDRGQRQVSAALRLIFSSALSVVEFRTVEPRDYRLFQVADLICTLALAARKLEDGRLSASELAFFGSARALKKNHLKPIGRKRF